MNIEPALVGKVAAAVRSERLKHTEPSDAALALAAIRAIFDWQPIETALVKLRPDLVLVTNTLWTTFAFYNLGQECWKTDFRSDLLWFRPTHWLPMIPLPEVE